MVITALFSWGVLPASARAQPSRVEMPGASNVTRVEATVLCGGATRPEAYPALRQAGFVSTINLRQASEEGADIDAHARAAQAVDLRFIHLPFHRDALEPATIEQFLLEVTDPANQPVYVQCSTANRVGALWFLKRRLADGWSEERALLEADAIGLTYAPLRDLVVNYARARVK